MLLYYNRSMFSRIQNVLITKHILRWLLPLTALGVAAIYFVPQIINRFSSNQGDALPHPTGVVCIDPGHPTHYSSGRRILNGTTELNINWEVSQKLSVLLKNTYHITVVETRGVKDQIMSNRERANIANKVHATLFIRLHCDAGPNHGFTLYYPDRQGEDQGVKGPSKGIIKSSKRAADIIHNGMADILGGKLKDRGVKGESKTKVGHKYGVLTASVHSQAPSVTIEMVFLNNRKDADFIKSEEGQDEMTQALAEGIVRYLESDNYHPSPS